MDKKILASAVIGAAALAGIAVVSTRTPAPEPGTGTMPTETAGKEQCYGVAKAGENGCAAADGSHTCGGLSTVDNSGQEWMMVDISTCSTMSGQLQAFNNTASDAAKAAADAKAAETPAPAGATSAQ